MTEVQVRPLIEGSYHVGELLNLYRSGALAGTLSRDPDEYDLTLVGAMLLKAQAHGFSLGVFDENRLCGEIHASRLQQRRFQHVFSDLTLVIHPEYQRRGIGKRLLEELLMRIDAADPPVLRTELILKASNTAALQLYERAGFHLEGRLRCRVADEGGSFVDDLYMARLNEGRASA